MFTPLAANLQSIRVTAFLFGSYWKFKGLGQEHMRSHNLKVLRKDLMLLCALYNVERRKTYR